MSMEPIYWQVAVSTLGVGIQIYIAERSRRQTARQSKDSLDMQHLISQRTTASFVADKRQKWIDELRMDMSSHLALSQEIVWKWDSMRTRAALAIEQNANDDQAKKLKICQEIADAFSLENGARDREHQERHIRIKFRLNPTEDLHINLRTCLDEIRKVLNDTQVAKDRATASALINKMMFQISQAAELTEKILKNEWSRVKQEVAYPDVLIATIPQPKKT